MKQKEIIGFVTSSDPRNRKSWSGIHYRMYTALKNEFSEIVLLGPLPLPKYLSFFINIIDLVHRAFGKRYNRTHNTIKSKYYASTLRKKLKNRAIDILFAPSASAEISNLETDIPICIFSDTTFSQIIQHKEYQGFNNLSKFSISESENIEQKALDKAEYQIFPSEWAANHARNNYNATNAFVLNMGANIDVVPDENEITKSYDSCIKLLFLGVEWERKGGRIVFETINQLHDEGYDFELTVCGCIPNQSHTKMKIIPFLDKNKTEDRDKFHKILCESHLLFLPSRAECYGIVFCEANAFGIPALTTNVGGIPSVIEHDINGYLLPVEAGASSYSEKIKFLIENKGALKKMSILSRKKYLEELNWEKWAKELRKILTE